MGRWAAIGGAVVVAALGLFKIVPWLTQDRSVITATPSLGGLTSAAHPPVKPGQQACIAPVPLLPTARTVVMLAAAMKRPQPLEVVVRGPGYRTSSRIAPDYPIGGDVPVAAPLPQSPPRELVGSVCIRNVGTRRITLAGTDEPRSQVAAESTVDGKPVPDLALTLYGDERSVLSRIGTFIDRAAELTGFIPTFLLWIIALAFFLGAPAGALYALATSFPTAPRTADAAAPLPREEEPVAP